MKCHRLVCEACYRMVVDCNCADIEERLHLLAKQPGMMKSVSEALDIRKQQREKRDAGILFFPA